MHDDAVARNYRSRFLSVRAGLAPELDGVRLGLYRRFRVRCEVRDREVLVRNTTSVIAVVTLFCSALFPPVVAGYSEETTVLDPVSQYGVGCLGEGLIGVSAAALGGCLVAITTTEDVKYITVPGEREKLPVPVSHTNPAAAAVAATLTGIGLVFGPAAGVYWRGSRLEAPGSFWAASVGSLAGLVAGGLVGGLPAHLLSGGNGVVVGLCGSVGALLAAPAGAVIGYNLSRPGSDVGESYGNRLGLPHVAIRQECLLGRSEVTVYDARLVTMRF